MCVSRGAPTKPSYGPCNEQHGLGDVVGMMTFIAVLAPILTVFESALESQTKEAAVCV